MVMHQIQGRRWAAPGDEAGDRERRDGREDTYKVGLRSLQEMGPRAGLETGSGRDWRPKSQQKQSSWIHGQEMQVGSQGAGCGLLVHSGLWQQLPINCGPYVMMVIEIVLPCPTLFPIFSPLEVQKHWSGVP